MLGVMVIRELRLKGDGLKVLGVMVIKELRLKGDGYVMM